MKHIQKALATLACAAASVCSAGPVTVPTAKVQFDNPIFNGSGFDNVSITYNRKDNTVATQGVAAGRFQGTVLAYSGVLPTIFVNGLNDL